jgi:DNA-directed RNA polymerase subunit RPC12/RpoP
MSDRVIRCIDCLAEFVWTEGEQEYFQSKQLQQPRRCPSCRAKRRAQKEQGGK